MPSISLFSQSYKHFENRPSVDRTSPKEDSDWIVEFCPNEWSALVWDWIEFCMNSLSRGFNNFYIQNQMCSFGKLEGLMIG